MARNFSCREKLLGKCRLCSKHDARIAQPSRNFQAESAGGKEITWDYKASRGEEKKKGRGEFLGSLS